MKIQNIYNLKILKIARLAAALLLTMIISLTATAQQTEADINQQITALTVRITAKPGDDNLYMLRGTAYFTLGKTGEALADADRALRLNPNSTNALFLRGQIRGGRKDYDGAIADFTPTINSYPNAAFRAYLKRGEMYEKKGNKEKARADYAKALEISNPKSAEAAESLARVGGVVGKVNSEISGKTGESFQSDVNLSNQQNPNAGGDGVVTSLNRLNFYTGASFKQTILRAEYIEDSPALRTDKRSFEFLLQRAKLLNGILKGRAEEEDLTGAIKKLQVSGNWKELVSDLHKINTKYKTSLATEQKWYFDVGVAAATIREGIDAKNYYMFLLADENFAEFIKSAPKGTPPLLVTSLNQTLNTLKNTEFGVNSPAGDYVALETQIKSIYRSIGQFRIEDKTGGK